MNTATAGIKPLSKDLNSKFHPENTEKKVYRRKICQIQLCKRNRASYTCDKCNIFFMGIIFLAR